MMLVHWHSSLTEGPGVLGRKLSGEGQVLGNPVEGPRHVSYGNKGPGWRNGSRRMKL